MPPVASNARSFLDHIEANPDPFAYLSSIPDPTADHFPFFEEEWIDFKGKPQDDKDAKRIWSKALSAFANITDGLIIWGIDARKTPPRNIDAACGLRLIPDPSAFESRLRDWIRDAANPPIMGVEFHSYAGPTGDGFVVCLIPESAHKPHRAEFADKHYYYRASDDFLMAEPGLLRVMFYPRTQVRLAAAALLNFERFTKLRDGSFEYDIKARLVILNVGNYTGNNVSVVVEHDQPDHPDSDTGAAWEFIGFRPAEGFHTPVQHSINLIAFASNRPIPPGFRSMVGDIKWHNKWIPDEFNESQLNHGRHFRSKISIKMTIYADNLDPVECSATFEEEDLKPSGEMRGKPLTPIDEDASDID
jgi:hypothetical protein